MTPTNQLARRPHPKHGDYKAQCDAKEQKEVAMNVWDADVASERPDCKNHGEARHHAKQ
jgi:hypothetical protein